MRVRRRVWLSLVPFGSNALSEDTPTQINAILAKTYGVVKPDLRNAPAGLSIVAISCLSSDTMSQ